MCAPRRRGCESFIIVLVLVLVVELGRSRTEYEYDDEDEDDCYVLVTVLTRAATCPAIRRKACACRESGT
jgi:hypothetical protein